MTSLPCASCGTPVPIPGALPDWALCATCLPARHLGTAELLRLVSEYGTACGQAGEHRAAAKHTRDDLTRAQHDTTAKNATDHAVALYRSILDHLIGPPPEPDPIVMPPRRVARITSVLKGIRP